MIVDRINHTVCAEEITSENHQNSQKLQKEKFKSVDLWKWPNPGIRTFGHNFCFILKSTLFTTTNHRNFGAGVKMRVLVA